MKVKDANKWLEKVQDIIHSFYAIRSKCHENPDIWEDFADKCELSISYKDLTYVTIESLCAYQNMFKEKIDNTEVK